MTAEATRPKESGTAGAATHAEGAALLRQRAGIRTGTAQGPMTLAVAVILIAAIYFARDVLVPIALSLLLSFLLAPLVGRLRRAGLPRAGAVLISVSLAAIVILVVIVAVTFQAVELVESLPQYRSNVEAKLELLPTAPGGRFDRFMRTIQGLNDNMNAKDGAAVLTAPVELEATTKPTEDGNTTTESPPTPVPVEVVAHSMTPLDVLSAMIHPVFTAGIVVILVVFILLAREDMRNRLIYLLGKHPGQMYVTTQVLDEAAARVSKYLLMQLIVAVCYGVPIGAGLFVIGVPNAILWGVLAIALRFVPYIGPWVAASFPIALAFAVDPGWSMVLWTALLFVVVELVLNNVIEPWLYGASAGMSPVGILLATVFWASLWGPVGLVVATPLTACLVALGKYIPGLSVLTLLLGDRPVIPIHARVYQRLLAMDPDEPDEIAREYLKDHSLEDFYGKVLIPVLKLVEQERHDNVNFGQAHYDSVIAHLRGLIQDFADHRDPAPAQDADAANRQASVPKEVQTTRAASTSSPPAVLCMPAHNVSDELVALMAAMLLRRRGIVAEALSAALLASERIERLDGAAPPVVCVCALPPYATVHTRNMVKRIRSCDAAIDIVVLFCEDGASADDLGRRITADATVVVVTAIDQAVEQIRSRYIGS